MANTMILKDVNQVILDASEAIAAGNVYALPTGNLAISWLIECDGTPANLDLSLEASLDGVTFVAIDTISEANLNADDAAFREVSSPYAAKFIRTNVTANADPVAVTVTVLVTRAN